ncbi:hypothetical protein QFZ64_003908 [Streptomyces sp. B3I8]|nr:hypothetical protein [Streptomyces sp. B3I8]
MVLVVLVVPGAFAWWAGWAHCAAAPTRVRADPGLWPVAGPQPVLGAAVASWSTALL